LATASGNSELVDTIRWLNDRLNPARLCDKDVLAGTGRELDALWASAGRTPNDLPERLVAFHDRRQDLAARTIRRLEGKPI
jgi:hypothetical protein